MSGKATDVVFGDVMSRVHCGHEETFEVRNNSRSMPLKQCLMYSQCQCVPRKHYPTPLHHHYQSELWGPSRREPWIHDVDANVCLNTAAE